MKTFTKKPSIIFAVILLLTIFIPPAFAVEGQTVEVNSYPRVSMSEEEIKAINPVLSVTNVLEVLDVNQVNPDMDGYYKAQAPVKITVLKEGGIMFNTYRVEKQGGRNVFVDASIPVEGEILVREPDSSGKLVNKTVPASRAAEYPEYRAPLYLPGCSVTLTEPGRYYTVFRYKGVADHCEVLIEVVGTDGSTGKSTQPQLEQPAAEASQPETAPVQTAKAVPTASKVMVNGVPVSFEAYNIGGSNYFKLRDLAKVVNGTEKQFEVTWDGSKNAINLVSNQPYTETGEELQKGDGQVKTAVLNTSKIYKDGVEVKLTAYTIKGNTYFKLRDIAAAFNIGVTWDGTINTVGIDTSSDYIVE